MIGARSRARRASSHRVTLRRPSGSVLALPARGLCAEEAVMAALTLADRITELKTLLDEVADRLSTYAELADGADQQIAADGLAHAATVEALLVDRLSRIRRQHDRLAMSAVNHA